MRPYICISHASADADAAQRFLRELTRYGFRYEAPDESVPRREREVCLLNAEAVIVLTSPAAAESGICAGGYPPAVGTGTAGSVRQPGRKRPGQPLLLRPGGERRAHRVPGGEAPDRGRVADYFHRLYLNRLCRCTGAFSAVRCVDDAGGRLIRLAVLAYRVCSGEKFARRDEYAAAVQGSRRSGGHLPHRENGAHAGERGGGVAGARRHAGTAGIHAPAG